jgi:hypothetical protein
MGRNEEGEHQLELDLPADASAVFDTNFVMRYRSLEDLLFVTPLIFFSKLTLVTGSQNKE